MPTDKLSIWFLFYINQEKGWRIMFPKEKKKPDKAVNEKNLTKSKGKQ